MSPQARTAGRATDALNAVARTLEIAILSNVEDNGHLVTVALVVIRDLGRSLDNLCVELGGTRGGWFDDAEPETEVPA